jgi:hypothetical protein
LNIFYPWAKKYSCLLFRCPKGQGQYSKHFIFFVNFEWAQ